MRAGPSPISVVRDWIVTGSLPQAPDPSLARDIATAAEQQGVGGLLAAAVRAAGQWPAEVRNHLRKVERSVLVRTVRHLDLAARVQRMLLERDLRSLPLKGTALAEQLYDSPAHRSMIDVDLLALDDWDACARVLAEAGFRRLSAGDHAVAFADPQTGHTLELHLSPVSCPGLFPVDAEGLWERRLSAQGQVPLIPAPEDLLVHLTLHAAFQHGLVLTLGQYLDLKRLLERVPLDGARLLLLARRTRAESAVATALRAAQIAVAARLPADLAPVVTAHLPSGLARWLEARAGVPLALVVPARPALIRVRLALSPGRRAALIRRTLLARAPGSLAPPWKLGANALRRALRLSFSGRGGRGPGRSQNA